MTAFTEATLVAQLDSVAGGRTITVERYNPNIDGTLSEIYAVGVVAPYAGRARWIQLTAANNASQAALVVIAGLA